MPYASAITPEIRDKLTPEPVTNEKALEFFDRLENGESVPKASKAVGMSRITGYRLLQRYNADVSGVRKLLAAKAYEAAEDWIRASKVASRKGEHKPAKEWLQTIGAVDVIGESGGSGITINIGTPDVPIAIQANAQNQAQILTLSPIVETVKSETPE